MNDYRPVALTSHLMKTLERLFLSLLRPQVLHIQDPLQLAYRQKLEWMMLFYTSCIKPTRTWTRGGTVRILFLDFSSAFNTIWPLLLQGKLVRMQVDPHQVSWITSYLTDRPQYVKMKDTVDIVVSSTGAPQGTVLTPHLFTLYTSDFSYNSGHIENFI